MSLEPTRLPRLLRPMSHHGFATTRIGWKSISESALVEHALIADRQATDAHHSALGANAFVQTHHLPDEVTVDVVELFKLQNQPPRKVLLKQAPHVLGHRRIAN